MVLESLWGPENLIGISFLQLFPELPHLSVSANSVCWRPGPGSARVLSLPPGPELMQTLGTEGRSLPDTGAYTHTAQVTA